MDARYFCTILLLVVLLGLSESFKKDVEQSNGATLREQPPIVGEHIEKRGTRESRNTRTSGKEQPPIVGEHIEKRGTRESRNTRTAGKEQPPIVGEHIEKRGTRESRNTRTSGKEQPPIVGEHIEKRGTRVSRNTRTAGKEQPPIVGEHLEKRSILVSRNNRNAKDMQPPIVGHHLEKKGVRASHHIRSAKEEQPPVVGQHLEKRDIRVSRNTLEDSEVLPPVVGHLEKRKIRETSEVSNNKNSNARISRSSLNDFFRLFGKDQISTFFPRLQVFHPEKSIDGQPVPAIAALSKRGTRFARDATRNADVKSIDVKSLLARMTKKGSGLPSLADIYSWNKMADPINKLALDERSEYPNRAEEAIHPVWPLNEKKK